jgi:hypothetical protein
LKITNIDVSNFQSLSFQLSNMSLDSFDLNSIIGLPSNCPDTFKAITLLSNLLIRKLQDLNSYVKTYFQKEVYSQPIRVNVGISFDRSELDEIYNFFVSSEIIRLSAKESNELIHKLKKDIFLRCVKMICNTLFENVMLQVTILEPQLYEPNIIINLKVNHQGANEFFLLLQPSPRVETLITKKESMPSHYGRTFLTDLLFDYFKKKNPNLEKDYEHGIPELDDCNTLDIFELLQQLDNSENCLGIERIPKPPEASKSYDEIPELANVSKYIVRSKVVLHDLNVKFPDLLIAIYMNFINKTHLRTEERRKKYWIKTILERIDPNLEILENWLSGGKEPKDFEIAVTTLLHLCGFCPLHVGTEYEKKTIQGRRNSHTKSSVSTDILIPLSSSEEEIVLCQCSTDWNDQKVTDLLNFTSEMRQQFEGLIDAPKLYPVVVTKVKKEQIKKSEEKATAEKVNIVDLTELLYLLAEVKKGLRPFNLARSLFINQFS